MAPGQDEEGGVDGEKDGVIPEDAIPRDAGLEDLHPDAHFGREEAGVDGLEGGDGEYSRYVLRLHLPLETNAGCALRVADEMRVWVFAMRRSMRHGTGG